MAKTTEDLLSKIIDKLDDLQKYAHNTDKDLAVVKNVIQEQSADIKALQEEQKRSNEILGQNTKSLDEHMRRTDILERLHKDVDGRLAPIEKEKIEQAAIKAHNRELVIRWAKIIGGLATAGTIFVAAKPFILALLAMI